MIQHNSCAVLHFECLALKRITCCMLQIDPPHLEGPFCFVDVCSSPTVLRLRNVSGSPGPKVPKKVHFIKSMRQYDTRGCR